MAASDLFLDSSGFYAALDAKDAFHAKAKREIMRTVKAGGRLVLTDYIITESLNLAVARRGHHVAVAMLNFLEQSRAWKRISVDSDYFDKATTFFRRHVDKSYSFTDCTSFVVMKTLRLKSALTDDHHFVQAGFQAVLKA